MSKIRSKPDQIDLVNSYMANGNVNGEKKTFRCKTCESKNRQTFFCECNENSSQHTHQMCVWLTRKYSWNLSEKKIVVNNNNNRKKKDQKSIINHH